MIEAISAGIEFAIELFDADYDINYTEVYFKHGRPRTNSTAIYRSILHDDMFNDHESPCKAPHPWQALIILTQHGANIYPNEQELKVYGQNTFKPLFCACQWPHGMHFALSLLYRELYEDLNTFRNVSGKTALMIAAESAAGSHGNPALVQGLLLRGADPSIMTPTGATALYYAMHAYALCRKSDSNNEVAAVLRVHRFGEAYRKGFDVVPRQTEDAMCDE